MFCVWKKIGRRTRITQDYTNKNKNMNLLYILEFIHFKNIFSIYMYVNMSAFK